MKGECPTCRAPCSLLGINLVLSSLLQERFPDVCQCMLTEIINQEYAKRREEINAENQRSTDDSIPPADTRILPIVLISEDQSHEMIPGRIINVSIQNDNAQLNQNALRFCHDSGSTHIAIMEGREGRAMMGDILRSDGLILDIRLSGRYELTGPVEENLLGRYLVGRFRVIHDDPLTDAEKQKQVDLLSDIKREIDKQWVLIGQEGRSRLLRPIQDNSPGLFGSTERLYLEMSDHERLPEFFRSYSSFEKLTFLLLLICVHEKSLKQLAACSRSTIQRSELILSVLRRPGYRLSIEGVQSDPREELFRVNSVFSAVALIIIVVGLLVLKGAGWFDGSQSVVPRYRI